MIWGIGPQGRQEELGASLFAPPPPPPQEVSKGAVQNTTQGQEHVIRGHGRSGREAQL